MRRTVIASKPCRRLRDILNRVVNNRLGRDAGWIQNHVAGCPRCRSRLLAAGRVNIALSLVKSEPQRADLLMRANAGAIGSLMHSLRSAPEARNLEALLPGPKLPERCRKYAGAGANLAACATVLLLMKVGVFSSMGRFQNGSRHVIRQYYSSQMGDELAKDVFAR